MFAVDISILDAKVTAVAVGNQVFVEMITYKVPTVASTIYFRLDNEEVWHHHYENFPDGKHVQALSLPVEHKSEVRVDVVVKLEGIRTWFKDNEVKYTQYVLTGE